ncbi:DeoR/GlpR transcriptional regulator [Pengzhenrongella frigida]|uniref:DeoR/GlpR transcriptional regulator n=2 Tax=Pengzhenrongella frigida TaxID=1259133 RepID=A0A4Q5MWT1_9MICO|nr:DeoR/GlpR transcriptional regulator [Cellulomonas sp. HLT2-17]
MLEMITDRQFVRVAELSDAFGISDVTVRADLDALDHSQVVRRVRGGAMARSRGIRPERSFEESLTAQAAEKKLIGESAAALVTSGMSVIIDVGTTTAAIGQALGARTDLEQVTVITNGLKVALDLETSHSDITVIVTGGTLRRLQHSLVDPMATLLLERLHADLAFIGCNGVDVIHGVTNLNLPETEIKRRMIAAAERTIVVADGSKIGQAHLIRVADLSEIASVLTGPSASAGSVAELRRAGIDVIQVE